MNISNPAAMTAVKTFDLSGTLNGAAYNASLDVVVAVGAVDTQEVMVFKKN